MKNIVIDCLASFWQLTTHVIFAKKAKVLFYYPQHFNRTAEGTNPFFDRLLDACDRHGISYKLIEEPDWGTDKPRNSQAIKGDVLFLLIMVMRRIARLIYRDEDSCQNETHIARWLNIMTLYRISYRKYVTISGSMQTLFSKVGGDCCALDMQHGILENSNPGWFECKGKLKECFHFPAIQWLLWGEGYKKCMIKGEEKIFGNRIHVVGYPLEIRSEEKSNSSCLRGTIVSNTILFSMQLTGDASDKWASDFIEMVEDNLKQIKELINQGVDIKVLIKHHPRFNNAYSIDNLFHEYPFATLTDEPMSKLLPRILLQVTYHSTTSFEYAKYGVPSFFMQSPKMKQGIELFYNEYSYPLYYGMNIQDVISRLLIPSQYGMDAESVSLWYKMFYTPFNEQKFLNLIEC